MKRLLVSAERRISAAPAIGSASYIRRDKARNGWKRGRWWQEEDQADEDIIPFPRERWGRNYELNYSLNVLSITPEREAFRNLHTTGLLMLNNGRFNKERVLTVDKAFNSKTVQSLAYTPELASNVVRETRALLSSIPRLFVTDAAVGDNPAASVPFRVVTDSPSIALALGKALPPVGGLATPIPYIFSPTTTPARTAFIATNYDPQQLQNIGVKEKHPFSLVLPAKSGDEEKQYSSTVLIMGGNLRSTDVLNGLAKAAAFDINGENSVLLQCAYSILGKNRNVVVMEYGDAGGRVLKHGGGPWLHGAHNLIWNQSGISRVWRSVQYTKSGNEPFSSKTGAGFGDFIERGEGTETLTTSLQTVKSVPPLVGHPAAVVTIVGKGSSNQVQFGGKPFVSIHPDQFKSLFTSVTPAFDKLVAANSTKLIAIDAQNKSSDIEKIVSSALEGNLK